MCDKGFSKYLRYVYFSFIQKKTSIPHIIYSMMMDNETQRTLLDLFAFGLLLTSVIITLVLL